MYKFHIHNKIQPCIITNEKDIGFGGGHNASYLTRISRVLVAVTYQCQQLPHCY
ncbi:hypothetical protein J6590_050229 [Homalodisca vitripennis]|nr:hypothetical protein J6590_050229 [Homalodisca vitripennis]